MLKLMNGLAIRHPEGGRTNAFLFPEKFIQVTFIGKSELCNNLSHAHITVHQPVFDHFDPVICDVLLHSLLGLVLKIPAEIGSRYAEFLADDPGPDLFGDVDIVLNILQDVHCLFIRLLIYFLWQVPGDIAGYDYDHRVDQVLYQFPVVEIAVEVFPDDGFYHGTDQRLVGFIF